MISLNEYQNLQEAYDFFNNRLFKGILPHVMITLQHGKKYRGYAWQDKFVDRTDQTTKICELALNPDTFHGRTDKCILSTLVHEQCHIWQFAYGKAGRRGYHNTEWGAMMKAVGLYPSSTGQTGGKETGEKVSHYVIDHGLFDTISEEFISTHKINWQSYMDVANGKKKKQTRAKFVCPECDQAAWAKPTAKLNCGECMADHGFHSEMIATTEEESEG